MKTFDDLYQALLTAASGENREKNIDHIASQTDLYDTHHLDCLLHPEKQPVIWNLGPCTCGPEEAQNGKKPCESVCEFHAIHPDASGEIHIDEDACTGCTLCIQECRAHTLSASKDVIPVLQKIRSTKSLVYALVAPAFLGQFSEDVTPGRLRSALKKAGFDGMIEVSLFADILTLKEALEFDRHITTENDYQLTSCCCPMWIAMIRKIFTNLVPHVPPAVSPMIAAGRAVKLMHPDAVTVFIGPCLAKKAEAREKDIAGAIDHVLTFPEVQDIFTVLNIDPAKMDESEKDHSSRAGRIYAYAGGVSEAVSASLEKISPNRTIGIKTKAASGVPACKALINEISSGNIDANFYEGMGCVGGCVGGPRSIIPAEEGKKNVERYGRDARYETPAENPYVVEMLKRLGLDTIESLIEKSDIFTRTF